MFLILTHFAKKKYFRCIYGITKIIVLDNSALVDAKILHIYLP